MIDVCVIGYGYWGPNLCRNFSNSPHFNLKAICDLKNLNLIKAKKDYPNAKIFKNFKKALEENSFKLIVLATPTSSHFKLAEVILKKSINILVEKPLCTDIKQHLYLNKLAQKNKVKIFVDFPFIYSGSIRYIENVINNKKFGNLKSVESYREQAPIRTDTNVLWDLTIHDISIISFLLRKDYFKISSVSRFNKSIKNYPKVLVNLTYDKKIDITLKSDWNSPTKVRMIKFVFEKATIYCDENETLYKIKIFKKQNNKFNQYSLEIPKIDLTEPLSNLAKHIQKNISKKNITITDNKFNLSITKIMLKLDSM